MSYKISGNIGTDSRILVFDETTGTITGNELVSSGEYEVLDVGEGAKTVLARKSDGETVGYGNISPIFYEAFGLLHTLDNPNAYGTSATDYFGQSVAISGDKCIVGAIIEDDAGGDSSGKAYIFDVTTGNLLHTLDNPNPYGTSQSDYFGNSVAIDGNKCIVGTPFEDQASSNSTGKVYIFDVTTGNLLHTLNNPNPSINDYFGNSISISGNKCIVGAHYEDDAGGSASGKAYIFDVTTGNLLHTLDNPNAYGSSVDDNFGRSVSISGDNCIVGAYGEDDAGGTESGKAYIFDVITGNPLYTLDNPNAYGDSAGDRFGYSIAISGDKCIVSARREDDSSGTDSGKTYIFNVTTGNLLYTLDNPNPYGTSTEDYLGYSVAISGNKCIVGAHYEDDAGGDSSGKAYIFDVINGNLLYILDNPNTYGTSASDSFGISISISGNKCIVGARGEDDAGGDYSGKAYIFAV